MDRCILIAAKAHATGDRKIEDAIILIEGEFPKHESLDAAAADHGDQAQMIERVLYNHLPGGTYDRILCAMLKRMATHFRVSHNT